MLKPGLERFQSTCFSVDLGSLPLEETGVESTDAGKFVGNDFRLFRLE